mmetsp:Transcript_2596/g.11112  ORF Transcript_2596/g.11112 Transcript_2596/m.11112 type:complete len:226 (-) Transcript_2596:811-1488(-)
MTDLTVRGLVSSKIWDYENGYYWFSDTRRIGKLLAHYELYKMATGIPGDVVECGVYKLASVIRFATFRSLLENVYSRKLFAFDAFGEFPTEGLQGEDDLTFVKNFETAGGDGLDEEEVHKVLKLKQLENNTFCIKGDVMQTIPIWLQRNPQGRIALLHLDMDVYEPTKAVLDMLWERLVRGGIVVVDDYNAVGGATRAIDEFIRDKDIKLQKLSWSHVPCFFVKD